MSAILALKDVHTYIENYHILQGVTFEVPENQVTMLLGRNGAGKTTTMRTIMKLWQASEGRMEFLGDSIFDKNTRQVAKLGMSYIPENMGIFSSLSVEENMKLAASKGPIDEKRLQRLFELFPALKKFWFWPAGKLSGGQKQMLAIARAVIEPCKLLLVDEPSKGLAPSIIESLIEAFTELKETETTILMVEQNFSMATRLGDHVAIMDDGKIVHRGDMAEFAQNDQLQQQYLGLNLGAQL